MADNNIVTIVLVGAGNRGRGVFGQYALDMPHRAKYVVVVEPDEMPLPKNMGFQNH